MRGAIGLGGSAIGHGGSSRLGAGRGGSGISGNNRTKLHILLQYTTVLPFKIQHALTFSTLCSRTETL
jgi:hypothetical protein